MRTVVITIIVLVLLVFLFGGVILFYQKSPAAYPQITPSPIPSGSSETTQIPSSPSPASIPRTEYISPVDWPPKVAMENKPFSCLEAGSETNPAGQTQKITVNNHTYCVTKETQGAAGSIYTQYAYARAKNSETEIFTFSLRYVQCGNYPEPKKTACEKERQVFNVDTFMDHYIQSHP